MKKIAYLECPTGIAGDMCLGALVDIGVPLEYLIEGLKGLGIEPEYHLWAEKVHRNGQLATKVHVDLLQPQAGHHDQDDSHHHTPARHLPEIEELIKKANLPQQVAEWSLNIFQNLALAEGKVHGMAPEKVHFHEVGATDAIIDIVGTCLGINWLEIEQLYCSAMPVGGGTVSVAHGRLPVPVPAVLKLWESRQVPVYNNNIEQELVTPTGAAITVTLAAQFGSPPAMKIEKIGLGAGTKDLPLPNILRLWLGELIEVEIGRINQDIITVLETQIDDLNPQIIGYIFEALFQGGAVDVFTQPIGMKKSRPGILLTVICPQEKVSECERIMFRETTTLGIRKSIQQRSILHREIQEVEIEYGKVRVKVASQGIGTEKTIINIQPEYEDCAALARKYNQPWRVIHQMVLDVWNKL